MVKLVVTGQQISNEKKGNVIVHADSKQEVWNNPKDFGFRKVFKVSFYDDFSRESLRNLGIT